MELSAPTVEMFDGFPGWGIGSAGLRAECYEIAML